MYCLNKCLPYKESLPHKQQDIWFENAIVRMHFSCNQKVVVFFNNGLQPCCPFSIASALLTTCKNRFISLKRFRDITPVIQGQPTILFSLQYISILGNFFTPMTMNIAINAFNSSKVMSFQFVPPIGADRAYLHISKTSFFPKCTQFSML